MELEDPVLDFCMLAESMGIRGIKVEKPDQLLSALESATKSETATLVEVFVENLP